jgi:hypothetical protein
MREQAIEIYKELLSDKCANLTSEVCSDPTQLQMLPFPAVAFPPFLSPGPRFTLDAQNRFQYMGRTAFAALWHALKTTCGNEIVVYGTEGYGKSFILAALACCLIRNSRVSA